MPQFEPEWFASQIFWLVIIFAGFYWLMSRKILPHVDSMLEARQSRLGEDLERAEKAKAEADAALAEYERTLADARSEAQSLLRDAQDRVRARSQEVQDQLARELGEKATEAEQRIEAAKREALANVRTIAVETAEAAVGRLLDVEVDRDRVEAAVDSRLAREEAA